MMELYTIGFSKKNAETFFNLLRQHGVQLLLDIRLNNRSQLAGFTKEEDLRFFLREIGGIGYAHDDLFAPTKELLSGYQQGVVSWEEYESVFASLMAERKAFESFWPKYGMYERVCLLCSEPTAERCHRRLVAEGVASLHPEEIHITHL